MENYFTGLGKRIREVRKQEKLTINTVAERANVSNGLISKVENGRTIPSLPVLLNIVSSLNMDIAEFFQGIRVNEPLNFIVTRKDQYTTVEKEECSVGFTYKSIFSKHFNSMGFEAVILEVAANSTRKKIESDAYEFKYILKGACTYHIAEQIVDLNQGDSLFFDGRVPHTPVNNTQESCIMLVVYFYLPEQNR